MDIFDKMSESLQVHPSKAQILLEVEDEKNTLELALRILKAHGIHPIEYDVIQEGNPSLVLFYLSTSNMVGIVLKLTEAGFVRVKGVDSIKGVRSRNR